MLMLTGSPIVPDVMAPTRVRPPHNEGLSVTSRNRMYSEGLASLQTSWIDVPRRKESVVRINSSPAVRKHMATPLFGERE